MTKTRYRINGREVTEEEFTRGSEARLREMLESRTPPMSNTDREFLEGRGGCYDQFAGHGGAFVGEHYRRVAEAHGQDVTGKVYLSGLARFPGDPEAWVSGRGDVKRVCEARGWACEGSVTCKMGEVAEATGGGLASDLVDRMVAERMREEPTRREQDVREEVIQNSAPHWAKREVT